jgi:hypothetical protein
MISPRRFSSNICILVHDADTLTCEWYDRVDVDMHV